MKKILALIFVLSLTFGCAIGRNISDDSFLEELLLSNLEKTLYTAHVIIAKTETSREIYSDSGQVGYIIFKVYADVIETFKGNKYDKIEYFIFLEAPSKGPPIGEEFIVSLHYSEEKDQYYIPDNGYDLPVTKRLKDIARSKNR
jgi:hypothetical protein